VVVPVDASACTNGGTMTVNGVVGSGSSAASFDIFLASQLPLPTVGRPVSCSGAYDVAPGAAFSLVCSFATGQTVTFGGEGNWGTAAGATNTFTYTITVAPN